jgi:hypothetical protein
MNKTEYRLVYTLLNIGGSNAGAAAGANGAARISGV